MTPEEQESFDKLFSEMYDAGMFAIAITDSNGKQIGDTHNGIYDDDPQCM